jgi:hypothetical protein
VYFPFENIAASLSIFVAAMSSFHFKVMQPEFRGDTPEVRASCGLQVADSASYFYSNSRFLC